MSRPRLTIGLPVFNGDRYLAESLSSILAQEFDDFELVVADNASTDQTREIVREHARHDDRVHLLTSATNRGAAWNYNRTVDAARGEYFKWAAHDDVLRPTFLSRCVEVLDARPEVVLCYPRAVDIDDTGRIVQRHELPPCATGARPDKRAREVMLNPSPCMESFGLIRTAALRRTGRIGPYTSSDRTLFLELALIGRFHEVPEVLFLHRQHPERSVHRYVNPRLRNLWFDPSWSGRMSAPRWRLLREYGLAMWRSPAAATDRARAAVILPLWAARNSKALVREAAALALGQARTPRTAG